MGVEEITALLRANLTTVILAVAAVVFLSCLALTISGIDIRRIWSRFPSATELRFRNVFAMIGENRRTELIADYAKKYRCSREDAMRHALDERDRDARSWR